MDVPLVIFLVLLGIGILTWVIFLRSMPIPNLRVSFFDDHAWIRPATIGEKTAFTGMVITVISLLLVVGRFLWIRLFP